MIRVGIIGCGKIAQVRHIPEYMANPYTQIKALYDFNTERSQMLAEQYNIAHYDSIDEILEDKSIDAISVCAANNAHAQITIDALNAGKHVLCEKPMATSLKDCEDMVAAARKNNRCLMIGQNQRLLEGHIRAKELLAQGAIGKILTFRTIFGHQGPETWSVDPGKSSWFFDKNKASMGALADLGVHKTDLIQFLLDQQITQVTAKITTLDKTDASGHLIGVDDNAICIFVMSGGAIGTMTSSWTYYGEENNSTTIYGTKGIMKIYDDPDGTITITRPGEEKIVYHIDAIQTNSCQTKSGIIDAFADALIHHRKPFIDGGDVLSSMRAIFACIESSETGKTINL